MNYQVTLTLPEPIYQQAQTLATKSDRSLVDLLTEIIAKSVNEKTTRQSILEMVSIFTGNTTIDRMKFNVILEQDEDDIWVIQCQDIPGCISQGRTQAEAIANIQEAIIACLQVRTDKGWPLTIKTEMVEVNI